MDRVESKRAVKAFLPRAKRVVNKVDPLDLVKMGASKDEYDDLVAEAARWLAAEVGDFDQRLATYVRSHYGVPPDRARIAQLGKELRAAWQSSR
ncbi:MAG: hypothetical protein WEF51_00115 [Chloroflexota bacterium]